MTITPDLLSAARANLVPSPSPPSDFPMAKDDGAKLGPAGSYDISEYVVFDYNPASIAIAHGAPVVASSGCGSRPRARPRPRKPPSARASSSPRRTSTNSRRRKAPRP